MIEMVTTPRRMTRTIAAISRFTIARAVNPIRNAAKREMLRIVFLVIVFSLVVVVPVL